MVVGSAQLSLLVGALVELMLSVIWKLLSRGPLEVQMYPDAPETENDSSFEVYVEASLGCWSPPAPYILRLFASLRAPLLVGK